MVWTLTCVQGVGFCLCYVFWVERWWLVAFKHFYSVPEKRRWWLPSRQYPVRPVLANLSLSLGRQHLCSFVTWALPDHNAHFLITTNTLQNHIWARALSYHITLHLLVVCKCVSVQGCKQMCVPTYVRTYMYAHVRMYVCTCVLDFWVCWVNMNIRTYVCMYVRMYEHMYIRMYVWW